jgi:hypothetical protein
MEKYLDALLSQVWFQVAVVGNLIRVLKGGDSPNDEEQREKKNSENNKAFHFLKSNETSIITNPSLSVIK